ncbi:MAG: hypothetical protein ABIT36_12710 [Steroidobacteraceae bacterium]
MSRLSVAAFSALLFVELVQLSVHAAEPQTELRAYVNTSCVVADEPFLLTQQEEENQTKAVALIAIVVGKLAEALLDKVVHSTAGRVSKTAARKDTRYAVAKEMNLYRADLFPRPTLNLNAQLGCMTMVAGRFAPDSVDCIGDYQPRTLDPASTKLPEEQWRSLRTDDSLANPLRRANICVAEEPQAVYESRFEFSPDGTTYRLNDAGYRVNSLLSTKGKNTQRNVFYTLEIAQPARTGESEKLSIALVDLGKVAAGARVAHPDEDNERWQRVPELSVEARRAFEQQTRVHHEVAAEIGSLERAITRHQRMVEALDPRIVEARGALKTGLQQEQLKNKVQVVALQGELSARKAEYEDLPRAPLQYMPVAIEVGVTETRSGRPALLAMADVVARNSGQIAAISTTLMGVPKSIDASAVADTGTDLERARTQYFDALVESRTLQPDDADGIARKLAESKQHYNRAAAALGLELLP